MPSVITAANDTLRGRLVRLSHKIDLQDLAKAIDVSRPTLNDFLRGDGVSFKVLKRIESWCERMESVNGSIDDGNKENDE